MDNSNKVNGLNRSNIVLSFVALIIFILLGWFFVSRPSQIPESFEESSGFDQQTQAFITNGDMLFNQLEGSIRYNSLTKDLRTFALTTIPGYEEVDSPLVVFQIDGKINQNNENIDFVGRFSKSNNKIEVRIKKLENLRQELSIKDKNKDTSFDELLYSNNDLNAFIANLPMSEKNYDADYNKSSDKVIITFNKREASLLKQTETALIKKLGSDYSPEQFLYIFPDMSVVP